MKGRTRESTRAIEYLKSRGIYGFHFPDQIGDVVGQDSPTNATTQREDPATNCRTKGPQRGKKRDPDFAHSTGACPSSGNLGCCLKCGTSNLDQCRMPSVAWNS